MNVTDAGAKLGLDESEYRELLVLFIETGGADFKLLLSALAQNNFSEAARIAHTIKGTSGNLGLMSLYEASARVEQRVCAQQSPMDQDTREMAEHFRAIETFLQAG